MPEALKRKPIVVHLGNVGDVEPGGSEAAKTRRYAARFPGVQFIGIDVKELSHKTGLDNWEQWKKDFKTGLDKLNDDSVTLISSDMSLGEYSNLLNQKSQYDELDVRRIIDYTTEIVGLAYKKLKKGGRLIIANDERWLYIMQRALENSPFNPMHIEIRPLTNIEYKRTHWTRHYGESNQKLYQIIVSK